MKNGARLAIMAALLGSEAGRLSPAVTWSSGSRLEGLAVAPIQPTKRKRPDGKRTTRKQRRAAK